MLQGLEEEAAPDLKSGGHGFKSRSDHLAGVVSRWTLVQPLGHACICIQLFREGLSYKRGEPYATTSKVIMGNGGFTIA